MTIVDTPRIQRFRLMLRCLCWFKSIGAIMSLALTNITRFTRYKYSIGIGNNVWKQATELAKRVAVEATARDPAYQATLICRC